MPESTTPTEGAKLQALQLRLTILEADAEPRELHTGFTYSAKRAHRLEMNVQHSDLTRPQQVAVHGTVMAVAPSARSVLRGKLYPVTAGAALRAWMDGEFVAFDVERIEAGQVGFAHRGGAIAKTFDQAVAQIRDKTGATDDAPLYYAVLGAAGAEL